MKYRIKTITRILPADLQTPVGIYLKVRDLFPQPLCWKVRIIIRLKIVFFYRRGTDGRFFR